MAYYHVTVVHDGKRNVIAEVMRQERGVSSLHFMKQRRELCLKKVNWIINLERKNESDCGLLQKKGSKRLKVNKKFIYIIG